LSEAAKEERVFVVKETGFHEVSADATVELLEPPSVILINEEPAGLDSRTYK
jgi:hypothetical protein